MTKYVTGSYENTIKPVEIERESESFVWVFKEFWGKTQRERKVSAFHQYHDSWDAAYEYLIERALARVEGAEEELERAREQMAKLCAMKAPIAVQTVVNPSDATPSGVQTAPKPYG